MNILLEADLVDSASGGGTSSITIAFPVFICLIMSRKVFTPRPNLKLVIAIKMFVKQ